MGIVKKTGYYIKGLKEKPKYMYSTEEMQEYENYVSEALGKYDKVYHELYSPDIHLDIIVIPPTKEHNYYKLVTEGMGAYKMDVPNVIKEKGYDRAELVMFLPPEWDMKFKTEESNWVIRQMKIIARTAIEEKSWIGFGHTFFGNEDASIPFAKNTKFTSTVLLSALDKEYEQMSFELPEKGKINFYQVFPLYKEELLYKEQFGTRELMEKFSDEDLIPIININRKNYCEILSKNNFNIEIEEELEK